MINRYIALDGTFNFRDIGGFIGDQGRTVKTGLLYRSDALYKLSDQDLGTLSSMGIRTIVDFRSPSEAAAHPNRLPDGVNSITLAPHADLAAQASASHGDDEAKIAKMVQMAQTAEGRLYFTKNLDSMAGQMAAFAVSESGIQAYSSFLQLLLEADTTPLIFHCKGGKDRTGWAAALVLSILGVSRDDIVADYMKTADYNQARNQKRMNEYRQFTDNETVLEFLSSLMQVKESYLMSSFAEVDKLGGLDAYLETVLGFTKNDQERFRAIYLM